VCDDEIYDDKEWLTANLERQTAHIAEVQKRKAQAAAKAWEVETARQEAECQAKGDEKEPAWAKVEETRKKWDSGTSQKQGGWGNYDRYKNTRWSEGSYQGNWKQDNDGNWIKFEEAAPTQADVSASFGTDKDDGDMQGQDQGKGRGKGKSKVAEKLARIETYTNSEDVWHTTDRKQMYEAWALNSYPVSRATEVPELGGPTGIKKVTSQEVEWSKSYLNADEHDVTKLHEHTVRVSTQVALNQLSTTLFETQHLLKHTVEANAETEKKLLSDQVRIHGFSYGSPSMESRLADVKKIATEVGMEARDVQDVQEEDKWGNLHKTAVIKFRNPAKAESFTSRMFTNHSKGIEIYDPVEAKQALDHFQQQQMEPWIMWMTKIEPSVEEMK